MSTGGFETLLRNTYGVREDQTARMQSPQPLALQIETSRAASSGQ
jgi:hypothetical protein